MGIAAKPQRRLRLAVATVTTALAALAIGVWSALGADRQGSDRPNILVIMSDEHNARVLGAYGNRKARRTNEKDRALENGSE